jgi:RecB family endonuclease NucS
VDDMLSGAALWKTGAGWQFASEAALEDFVYANLKQLLGLTPLKQQYSVKGQFCDILAVDGTKRLVILELKNTEDRYIVQQLTRYYDALLEEKAFQEEVDYGQPVRLIAIKPIFHRDNFTDRKYHRLYVQFLKFSVIQDSQIFYLQIKDIDNGQVSQLEIPYREINFSEFCENVSEPPRLLLDWLGSCTSDEQQGILKIRSKMLNFDKRMQEILDARSIKYGKGKSKLCAELCFERKSKKVALFLWLNIPNRRKQATGRMQVHTDWVVYSQFSHVPEGFYDERKHGTFRLMQGDEWVYDHVDVLIDKALETWQNRL